MRVLTFSFLKSCKFKQLYSHVSRKYSDCGTQIKLEPKPVEEKSYVGKPDLYMISPTWPADQQDVKEAALKGMQVHPDFITEEEEDCLMKELEPVLKRMRYEYDHWDNAIHGYKETERTSWKAENEAVLSRVRSIAFATPEDGEPLPYVHVLDLAPSGVIKPHVDAVRFCGPVIAGLCLMSSAIMRLVHEKNKDLQFDALLPRRGLYIMKGTARYDFTHAVLGGDDSVWRGERLVKKRRVAVICRSKPPPPTEPNVTHYQVECTEMKRF